MPSRSDCSNEHTRQPAPLESNAVQPMHHRVSGARFCSARLGYDGGGDSKHMQKRRHNRNYDASILNLDNSRRTGVTRTLTQKLGISADFLKGEVLEEVT
jgi:hypothetical protein